MDRNTKILVGIGVVAGVLIAVRDTLATGDDADMLTLGLLLVTGAVGGFVQPRRAWLWALTLGPWLSLVSLAGRAFGYHDHMHPDTIPARLALLPVGIVAAFIGAYAGALARKLTSLA